MKSGRARPGHYAPGFAFFQSQSTDYTHMKPENETTEETATQTGMKGLKVLVAEDIALNQLLLKALLDEFGCSYDFAGNGQIAIDKLSRKKYDIILMDLQMPEMNGFESAEHIRQIMRSDIPIIALTADITTEDVQKCKAAGMNDYIEKPIDEKLLYAKVTKLLNKPISPEEALNMLKQKAPEVQPEDTSGRINLAYLKQRTKDNPELMKEMIRLYLQQTPELLETMKQAIAKQDWTALYDAIHKMIPSFWMMGINTDFEYMAKTIKDCAVKKENLEKIPELFKQVESVCLQACKELEEELARLG
jgi:CheY-like chemotaxis protein